MLTNNLPIYFDYAASTPVLPEVVNAMLPYLHFPGCLGTATSSHAYGKNAELAVTVAREQVAALLHAHPDEIVFTSGATESINLAIKGVMQVYGTTRKHIVTMHTEHKAVLSVCQWLQKQGYKVTYLTPNRQGAIDFDELIQSFTPDTALCSLMHINNETGVVHDIDRIGALCHERGIIFHVDAAQSCGKLAIDFSRSPIDLLSCTAHKLYGPKGVGVLYVRAKPPVRVAKQLHGGGQERNLRSGTLAIHQIVGMGAAAEYARMHQVRYLQSMHALHKQCVQELHSSHIRWHTPLENFYPGIVNIALGQLEGGIVLTALQQFAISTTAACQGKSKTGSHVLRAMGYNEREARQAVRISFGWQTKLEEVIALTQALNKLAASSHLS